MDTPRSGIAELYMKDKDRGQAASLRQTRDTLVTLRTSLKNKVIKILAARGFNLSKEALSSDKELDRVLCLPVDQIVRIELVVIVEEIRTLDQSIGELDKKINIQARSAMGAGS